MTQDLSTQLIHHPYTPPDGWEAPQVGVHKASTVIFKTMAAVRNRDWRKRNGYAYGLHSSPTLYHLEERIATLEGGQHCVLVPSGLAAITLVNFALLKAGDEVLLPNNVYGPSRELARHELARCGVSHRLYDPMNAATLAGAISDKTRLIWLEAPGSVTMEFPDLPALVAVAKARGVTTAIDNTWGAGLAFRAFDVGIDIVMQALTKFPSGGGDVLMGSVVTRDAALFEPIKMCHSRMGWGVAANDIEFILRSLPSMAMRYAAQDAAGRELAAWLGTRPEVTQVLHPALEGAPGHAHWKATCSAAAGLFSVMIDARFSSAQVDQFVEALKLFKIGYSWAGPMSLVVAYDLAAMRGTPPYAGTLVRFSMGLEAVADLRADIEQALSVLAR